MNLHVAREYACIYLCEMPKKALSASGIEVPRLPISPQLIERRIFVIRERNEAVNRNRSRFPDDFMLELTDSDRAVQVNIAIMRAFVRLRELSATHADLARKLEELDRIVGEDRAEELGRIQGTKGYTAGQ